LIYLTLLQYLVNDRMLARCGAQIRIEVIDRATGRLCDSDLSDIFLEVSQLIQAAFHKHCSWLRTVSVAPKVHAPVAPSLTCRTPAQCKCCGHSHVLRHTHILLHGIAPPPRPPVHPSTNQVFILNGASYDQHFLDATRTSSLSRADSSNPESVAVLNRDLDDCALLTNNKGKPLLASLVGGKSTGDGKLLIQAVVSRSSA
jgi:hypothetical protein